MQLFEKLIDIFKNQPNVIVFCEKTAEYTFDDSLIRLVFIPSSSMDK